MKNHFYVIRLKKTVLYSAVLSLIFLLMLNPEQSINALQDSMLLCYQSVIPSLFPFFVLSGILTAGGFASVLSRLLSPVMRPIFALPGAAALPFGIGIMSGYPTGAKAALELCQRGSLSRHQTECLLPFCNNSGPLFVIGAIGTGMLGTPELGVYLYIIHILSALCVGLCFRFFPDRGLSTRKTPPENHKPKSPAQLITDAISTSVTQMLTVCGFILFFSALSACLSPILDKILPPFLALFCKSLLELSVGAMSIVHQGFPLSVTLPFLSFAIGFGGLCVFLQVAGILSGSGLSLIPYFFGKLLHGLLAAVLTYLTLPFLPENTIPLRAVSANASAFCTKILFPGPFITILFLMILFINYKNIVTK